MNNQVPKSWVFLFLAVTAVLIGIYFTTPTPTEPDASESLPETSRTTTFEEMLEHGENAIYLEDQTAGQTEVVVGYVVLSSPGYVVIYGDEEGVPGEEIGSSALLEEGGEHISLRVDDVLVDGDVYYAMLWHDDGDGLFRDSRDTQVNDSADSVILMTFEASANTEPESGAVMP